MSQIFLRETFNNNHKFISVSWEEMPFGGSNDNGGIELFSPSHRHHGYA